MQENKNKTVGTRVSTSNLRKSLSPTFKKRGLKRGTLVEEVEQSNCHVTTEAAVLEGGVLYGCLSTVC
jgi:hypothetical protein